MAKTKKVQKENDDSVTSIQSGAGEVSQVSFESRNAKGSKVNRKPRTATMRAGITFPPTRIRNKMKAGNYAAHIGVGAGVYCAAALEYLVAEILELAGNAAHDNGRKTVKPRHITLAVRNDDELNKLLGHVTFAEGGVMPNLHPVLVHARNPLNLSRAKFEEVMSQGPKPKKSKGDKEDENDVKPVKKVVKNAKAVKKGDKNAKDDESATPEKVEAKLEAIEEDYNDDETEPEDSDSDDSDVEMTEEMSANATLPADEVTK